MAKNTTETIKIMSIIQGIKLPKSGNAKSEIDILIQISN
jgi:hypothetical protein